MLIARLALGGADSMDVSIRGAEAGDAAEIAALIVGAFQTFIAPDYGEEGQTTFARFAAAEAIVGRLAADSGGWVASRAGEIVGYIEMLGDHISLLFVRADLNDAGIAGGLLKRILGVRCGARVTVNSSPYARPMYERLGFVAIGPESAKDGIIAVPMARRAGG